MSLSVTRFMLDVNRGDVAEVLDVRVSSSDRHLGSSVYFVFLPSAQYRGVVAVSPYSFLHQRLDHGLSATGCVRAFSLVTKLLLYDSTQNS